MLATYYIFHDHQVFADFLSIQLVFECLSIKQLMERYQEAPIRIGQIIQIQCEEK